MRILYHIWLSAQSRIVRLLLAEKDLHCDLKVERVWEQRPEFLALNPTGEVPLLIEPDGTTLTDVWVIVEYMEEMYPEVPLLGANPLERAETRRLLVWFDQKCGREVTENLVGEKFMKRVKRTGLPPNSDAIRAGRQHMHYHLEYISYLAASRRWLAGDEFSLADIAAAAHLSVVDYLGDVPWDSHPEARQWYSRIKSRPSFRPLLEDHVPGIPAPAHYRDLDF